MVNLNFSDLHYSSRLIKDILNKLKYGKLFYKFHIFKAHLHIPADDTRAEIQIFPTHRGSYRVHRLSFGIKTAINEFQNIEYDSIRH